MPGIITVLGGTRVTLFLSVFFITLSALLVQTMRFNQQRTLWLGEKIAASQALAQAIAKQREIERQHVIAIAAIGEHYEHDKAEAAVLEAILQTNLRNGAVRLRQPWRDCNQQLSQSRPPTGQRDASTPDRAALAGALVRAGRDADDQIKACQAVINTWMMPPPKDARAYRAHRDNQCDGFKCVGPDAAPKLRGSSKAFAWSAVEAAETVASKQRRIESSRSK